MVNMPKFQSHLNRGAIEITNIYYALKIHGRFIFSVTTHESDVMVDVMLTSPKTSTSAGTKMYAWAYASVQNVPQRRRCHYCVIDHRVLVFPKKRKTRTGKQINDPSTSFSIHSLTMSPLREYLWIAVFGGILGFAYGFLIGANDVANAFASSVSSKSITLK